MSSTKSAAQRHKAKHPNDKTVIGAVPNFPSARTSRATERCVFGGVVGEYRLVVKERNGSETVLKMPHLIRSDVFPAQVLDVLRA